MNNSNNNELDKEIIKPTSKNKKKDFWLSNEGLEYVFYQVMTRGHNDTELIKEMNVSHQFFYSVLMKNSEFSDNLTRARQISLKKVEKTSFEMATENRKVYKQVLDRQGNIKEVYEELPPDPRLMQFLLKTRRRDIYGDKTESENKTIVHIQDASFIKSLFGDQSQTEVDAEEQRAREIEAIDKGNE